MNNDLINGLFEFLGAIFIWKNFFTLLKDKEVKGIYYPSVVFFTLWGIWNIFYYPSLNQWISFVGGIVLALGNVFWVVYMLMLKLKKKDINGE